jgi:hypothetical protein
MGVTGWLGEAPDEVPPMPVTEMMLARQQRRAGPLETALARSAASDIREAREAAANAPDPDERAANLVVRGYTPGLLQELSQRLGDTTAELEAERDKLEKAARRAQFAAREHAAGRADVSRMLSMMDGDDGDESRVALLERRAESLRRQIAGAQAMIAPPQARDPGPVEAASRAAHEVFREVTRARWADVQGGSRPRRERPPFDSVSRGRSTEHTGPDCRVCAAGRGCGHHRGHPCQSSSRCWYRTAACRPSRILRAAR